MSKYKCCASIDGICKNAYGYGVKCRGYSEECRLREAYERIQMTEKGAAQAMRKALGIKGDCE